MFGPLGTCVACSDSELPFCVFLAQMQQECHTEQELKSEELVLLPKMQSAWVTFLAVPIAQQQWKREVRAQRGDGTVQAVVDAIR